jgi:hypothetical protein
LLAASDQSGYCGEYSRLRAATTRC